MKFYIKSLLLLLILSLLACPTPPQSSAKFRIAANLAARENSIVNPYYKIISEAFTLAADGADKNTIIAKLRDDKNNSILIGSLITAFEQGTASAFTAVAKSLRVLNNEFGRAAADAFDAKADELK